MIEAVVFMCLIPIGVLMGALLYFVEARTIQN